MIQMPAVDGLLILGEWCVEMVNLDNAAVDALTQSIKKFMKSR